MIFDKNDGIVISFVEKKMKECLGVIIYEEYYI